MQHFPVPPIALFDPDFIPVSTSSAQPLTVDSNLQLKVVSDAPSGSSNVAYGRDNPNNTVRPISVDENGYLNVNAVIDPTAGVQRGACTDAAGLGYTTYDASAFTTLDSIAMLAGDKLQIYGINSAGNVQASVELIIQEGVTIIKQVVGFISEVAPNYSPNLGGIPIEITASAAQDVILRIKGTRANRTGQGSGRIFARKI